MNEWHDSGCIAIWITTDHVCQVCYDWLTEIEIKTFLRENIIENAKSVHWYCPFKKVINDEEVRGDE